MVGLVPRSNITITEPPGYDPLRFAQIHGVADPNPLPPHDGAES